MFADFSSFLMSLTSYLFPRSSLQVYLTQASLPNTSVIIAYKQDFLFGRMKRVSRERTSERRSREGQGKGEILSSAPCSRVFARLTSLAQIGELARRLVL